MGKGLIRAAGLCVGTAATLSACGSSSAGAGDGAATVPVVAAENQYGNVVAQIGGEYVSVFSVDSNPNIDPHTYEATPEVAAKIAGARLLVENGLGYDSFMGKLASASPSSGRKTIDVQRILHLPDSTPNPHLWYKPTTMPAVARAITSDLVGLDPAHARAFRANDARFVRSLKPWLAAIAQFRARYRGVAAAATEPVADYLLRALGIRNRTPFRFQADIMNGTDPTPQDLSLVEGLLAHHAVKLFVYNEQVTDSLTASIRQSAAAAHVPVVGVYETMPTPGYTYQSWMMAEVAAIRKAVGNSTSTGHL